jgi:hypothetical protein
MPGWERLLLPGPRSVERVPTVVIVSYTDSMRVEKEEREG